jgi:3-dehydroquinate synthase
MKNEFRSIEKLAADMLRAHLSRRSCVVVAGGGAVLDAVGFAASLVHRGLRLIRLPTTVLSQSDGGVGVKNGINFSGQKNALGVFSPPSAVVNDFDFLKSLDDRHWHEGIAEAFKVSIIRDRGFFEFLARNATKLHKRDVEAMEHLVFRCAELHLDHIRSSGDPFEFGHARPLDFGHWSAHKLETMSNFSVSHGEAVAIGVLLDSLYAVSKGWLTRTEFNAIHAGFAQSGLPLWLDALDTSNEAGHLMVFEGIAEFQEHLGGKLCVTFPKGIGNCHEMHEIDLAAMADAVKELKLLSINGSG